MKKSKFIELLNLYVDQQITPAEAAELEAEIVRDPARRRTYLQYCRMHRACTQVFESFQAPAAQPLAQALRQADEKIVALPQSRGGLIRFAWAAGFAAAACVTMITINRRVGLHSSAPAAAQLAQVDVPPESFATAAALPDARPVDFHPVLVVNKSLSIRDVAALEPARANFDWMKQVRLSAMPADVTVQMAAAPQTDADADSDQPDISFRRLSHQQAAVEMTAFEFQK